MNIFTTKPLNLWSYSSLIMVIFSFFFTNKIIAQDIHAYEHTAREHIEAGEFSKAIFYLEKAQEAYINQQKYEDYLRTYAGFGMCFYLQEKMDSMEIILNRGAEAAKEYTLEETEPFTFLLQLEGVLYEHKGEYAKALQAAKRNIELSKILGEEEAANYNNIAAIYRRFADFDTAIKFYNEALKLEPKDPIILHNIGVVLSEKGENKKAIEFFNRSLQFREEKEDILSYNVHLGSSYLDLEDYDMALSYLKKAEVLVTSSTIESHGLYRVLALTHACKKQYTKAHDYIDIAIEKYPKGTKHPILGKAYNMKASIYAAENKHKEALENYELALNNLVSSYDKNQEIKLDSVLLNPELLESLIGKGESKAALKHSNKDVLELYLSATKLIDSMRVNFVVDGSKYHLIEKSIPTIYETAIKLALETGNKVLAFELSEKNKAGVLLEKAQKVAARKYLNSAEPMAAGITFEVFQSQSLEELVETPKLKDIQESIDKGQAVVSYFVGKEKTYAFVMARDRIESFSFDNIKRKDRDALIASLRNSECAMNSTQYTKLAYEIYQKTLQPIKRIGHYERLVIIPDDLLSSIPFDALLTEASTNGECRFNQLSYVLKTYSIGYAYSANLWYLNKQNPKSLSKPSLAAFAPLFSKEKQALCNNKRDTLGQLDNRRSAEEICKIRAGKSFLGKEGSMANFKKYAEEYDILHLSTHACMDDNNSENHRIFFSDEAMLSSEIYEMQLNARLAVLSACETGLGYMQRGEGVMSLARSFTAAGCPSVVMSLWSVNDQSTTEIMVKFHDYLGEGMEQDLALQQAKIKYLEGKSNAKMNPYYWAAFVQIGDADSLGNTKKSNPLGYVLVLLGIVGVVFFMVRRKTNS